jgi:glycosyltransferase involved in cell wall biosynthesis
LSAPRVSVVIPAYNAAPHIGAAIDSVVGQTYTDLEIIVVDDGSVDNTAAVLQTYNGKIRYVRQENRGVSSARNHGIRVARGELIAFLDADDTWLPDKLELQTRFLSVHEEAALVFGDLELVVDGQVVEPSYLALKKNAWWSNRDSVLVKDAFARLVEENVVSTSTTLISSRALQQVGPFDEDLSTAEDLDLWLRVAASFPIGCIPRVMCRKHVLRSSLSADYARTSKDFLAVLNKYATGVLPSRREHEPVIRSMVAQLQFDVGYSFLEADDLANARRHFGRSLSRRFKVKPLLYYALTFLDRRALGSLRLLKRKLRA